MEAFKPIINNIDKFERKFICTKKHLLDDFLATEAEYLHKYRVSQKYTEDSTKYRKYGYKDENGKIKITCTKHTKTQLTNEYKQVNITEITLEEYDSIKNAYEIDKKRKAYRIKNTNIYLDIDTFTENKDATLIEVWATNKEQIDNFKTIKGLEEVTGIKYYSNEYIATNQDNIINKPLLVIEGTDLTGKTTLVKKLIKNGYLCMDRDQYDFSNYVDINKTPEECAESILENYKKHQNRLVIVLCDYLTSGNLLKERLEIRKQQKGKLSKYDEQCVEYNKLYIDIVSILKKKMDNILAYDISTASTQTIGLGIEKYVNTQWFNKVYIAAKFKLQGNGSLADKLKNDIRSLILESSKKLTINTGYVKIPYSKSLYTGPFYCEQASNGNYTSTDCNTVVTEELKAVANSDVFIVYLDENYSCGSITELIYAAEHNKKIVIIYKEESDIKYETKSEHWFAITAVKQLSKNVIIKQVKDDYEAVQEIKNYLISLN